MSVYFLKELKIKTETTLIKKYLQLNKQASNSIS